MSYQDIILVIEGAENDFVAEYSIECENTGAEYLCVQGLYKRVRGELVDMIDIIFVDQKILDKITSDAVRENS